MTTNLEKTKEFRVLNWPTKSFFLTDGVRIEIKGYEYLDLFIHKPVLPYFGTSYQNSKEQTGYCVSENKTGALIITGAVEYEDAYHKAEEYLKSDGVDITKFNQYIQDLKNAGVRL